MKKYFFSIIAVAMLCFMTSSVARAQDKSIDEIYSELDEAIERSDEYQHKKEQLIEGIKQKLLIVASDNERYKYQLQLYEAYDSYNNAKAVESLYECVKISQRQEKKDQERYLYTLLAYQRATGGFFAEAISYLDAIITDNLSAKTNESYLFAKSFTYGEMAAHTNNTEMIKTYRKRAQTAGTGFFEKANKTSKEYYLLQISQFLADNKVTEAQKLCQQWQKSLKENTKDYALMAYYMSECWRLLKNTEKQRYWLCISAICDVKNAIMNQASLWTLAEILNKEGDMERSQRYIDYSWKCNTSYGAHLRSWQVAPVITTINNNYRESLSSKNTKLTTMVIVISIMAALLLLCFVLLYLHNKQLSKARNQLRNTNNQLATLNVQLQMSNLETQKINRQLQDSNMVKDEYIARFLSLCSQYVDKIENFRIKINRKLAANQLKDALRITGSKQILEDETQELFRNFDDIFLRLFPNFVEEFNSLLKPQYRQKIGSKRALTSEMRMAALIRLGIEDSSSIAEFLRLSYNTVYNYRARLKTRAEGDRNDFEERVKNIGLGL